MPKSCLLVCQNLKQEFESSLAAQDIAGVDVVAFPCFCGTPAMDWLRLKEYMKPACQRTWVLGSACLAGLKVPPQESTCVVIHRLENCFQLFAGKTLVDKWFEQGNYLITPGWLARWREYMEHWKLDQTLAPALFSDSVRKLLLLDTGVDSQCDSRLKEFGEFLHLPVEKTPVGLDMLNLLLSKLMVEWELEDQRKLAQSSIGSARRQSADYAMASDFLGELAQLLQESEVIAGIAEMFKTLFAPTHASVATVDSNSISQIQCDPKDASEATLFAQLLDSADRWHGWNETGEGFWLLLQCGKETLGIIEVAGFRFPEYKEHYFNLALALGRPCGMALRNARTFQKLEKSNAELQSALDNIRVLRGLLPICSSCKKIRNDSNYWEQIESYISRHSDVLFTHGICPDCIREYYPEIADRLQNPTK